MGSSFVDYGIFAYLFGCYFVYVPIFNFKLTQSVFVEEDNSLERYTHKYLQNLAITSSNDITQIYENLLLKLCSYKIIVKHDVLKTFMEFFLIIETMFGNYFYTHCVVCCI